MERIAVGVAAIFFGPILIGAFFTAVWPALLRLLESLFWISVLIASVVGLFMLAKKLWTTLEEESAQRNFERETQETSRRQLEELQALHTRVLDEYDNVFDGERRRSQPLVGP